MVSNEVTVSPYVERERAYYISIPLLLKIPYFDEIASFGSASRKMGKIHGYNQPISTAKKDTVFTWTDVFEDEPRLPVTSETCADKSEVNATRAATDDTDSKDPSETKCKYTKMIIGEEEPYCTHRLIHRGHFNVSQQVCEDLIAMRDRFITR